MPIYEYQCKACGKVNEVMQKIDAAVPATCNECSGGPLTKLLSKSGFILKGSGWYVTDFRGNSSGKAGGVPTPSKDDSSSSSGSSETKVETKSEAKSETKTESPSVSGCATGCGHSH
jgi:putative FmdB family regulatory protein